MKVQQVVNGELVEVDELETEELEIKEPEVEEPETKEPETEELEVDDGNSIQKELEPWQKEDPEGVPTATHIHMKQKLKGRISEKDSRIETLETEIADLKASTNKPVNLPTRPKKESFESDDLYQTALDEYEEERDNIRYTRLEQSRTVKENQRNAKRNLDISVEEHYERAGKLITETGIDEKVYRQADEVVRSSIEAVRPKQGDVIVDQLIQLLGEGSEKVFYFLGRNKTALTEVKSLLAEDPGGMKAAIFLGQQKERLLNPKKPTSSAPAPSANPTGDTVVNENKKVSALRKKYKKAHEQGNLQMAYDTKREARLLGTDTTKWHEEV